MRFLAVLLLVLATPAAAQQGGGQYGDWTLRCGEAQGAKVCSLRQQVQRPDEGGLLAEVSLNMATVQGTPRVLMVMNAPDGVALNIAPGFIIDGRGFSPETGTLQDGGAAVNLSWRTCIQGLCRAAVLLTPQVQGAIMAGNVMTLGYRRFRQENTTAFPISLRGVTAGLAALASQ